MGTMSSVNVANAAQPANAIGRCQVCGSMRQTAPVTFNRNIGMIVLRQTRSISGNMCKTCLGKNYWQFMGLNLLLGPWGMISLIITPIYFVTNTVSYFSAAKKLRGAVE
jgi:hypothetical protein